MNSNDLKEHIRKLNEQEQVQHELRRQAALNKIRDMRNAIREQQERHREKQ